MNPDAAKKNTPEGAVAFVRYFNAQLATAWTKPDAAAMKGLCMPTSKACSALMDTATALQQDKQRYDRSPISIRSVKDTGVYGGAHRVQLNGSATPARVVNSSNKVVEVIKEESVEFAYYVRWNNSSWIIEEIKVGTQ